MEVGQYTLSWASYAYAYCILTLLCGDGVAALYYNDRRGQPELQQAMDNAPLLSGKNLPPFPSKQHNDIPILLTEKTSALLSEALRMLQKIKDVREKKWFEAFVSRLGSLATDLKKENSIKTTNKEQGPVLQPFDVIEHTVPPPSGSVAVARKFYKVQTKNQVTSAQVNDVLPRNINREAVTKPSFLFDMKKTWLRLTNDDLVKQLHNQNRRMKSKSSLGTQVAYNARLLDSTVITQAVTPPMSNNRKNEPKNIVQAQIKVGMQKKEPEKEVRNLFQKINSQHLADFIDLDFRHGQKNNLLQSTGEVEVEKNENTIDEPEESEELVNNTGSPSWQHVVEAAYDRAQLHEPLRSFIPAEPTMSDEMQRELRAGKIVVLSHSLVKTNFKSKHRKNKQELVKQAIPLLKVAEIHVPSKLSWNHSSEHK